MIEQSYSLPYSSYNEESLSSHIDVETVKASNFALTRQSGRNAAEAGASVLKPLLDSTRDSSPKIQSLNFSLPDNTTVLTAPLIESNICTSDRNDSSHHEYVSRPATLGRDAFGVTSVVAHRTHTV